VQQPSAAVDEETSTRRRILVATSEVLKRNGRTKLSLSEVALQAGVSRPTLYRWFASTEELLDAFGRFEQHEFEPEVTIAQLSEVIPVMRTRLQRLVFGPNAAVKAATAIRVAVSHYIVRSDDADEFLAQLRHAVGIKPTSAREAHS
jgi:AcrR family transcriptional regulator